jgi:selenide,water dikinase
LLALGDKVAIASRNGMAVKGRWVWRWKDSIDQRFMRQFAELPMSMPIAAAISDAGQQAVAMPCGGCGSKLGPELLAANLDILSAAGSHEIEDAALWQPTPGTLAVQTIDGFRGFMADESCFAQICVNHALSDIYAMGANPIHIQAWINLAFSGTNLQQRDHLRMLRGIQAALSSSQASLSGGHSSEGAESHLGVVANGEVTPGAQWSKSGAQPGDLILLSKALGTGVVMAADMQGQAAAAAVEACYESMLLSNHRAMQQLQHVSPNAVTDVTGFGLIGHLLEMLDSANKSTDKLLLAQLNLADIPLLTGALGLAEAGWRSSLYPQLEPYLLRCNIVEQQLGYSNQQWRSRLELLLDPQTSGGLLVTMNQANATALLDDQNGYQCDYVVIGKIKQETRRTADQISIDIVV